MRHDLFSIMTVVDIYSIVGNKLHIDTSGLPHWRWTIALQVIRTLYASQKKGIRQSLELLTWWNSPGVIGEVYWCAFDYVTMAWYIHILANFICERRTEYAVTVQLLGLEEQSWTIISANVWRSWIPSNDDDWCWCLVSLLLLCLIFLHLHSCFLTTKQILSVAGCAVCAHHRHFIIIILMLVITHIYRHL